MHQSPMLLSQSCINFPACSGYQVTFAASFFIKGRISSEEINHSETNLKTNSSLHLQHFGYLCLYFCILNNFPCLSNVSITSLFTFFTCLFENSLKPSK